METCKDLPGSAVGTVVLVVDLVGAEMGRLPERVAVALRDKTVEVAIRNALQERARAFLAMQQAGKPIEADEAAKSLATGVGQAVLTSGRAKIVENIKAGSEYRAVERGLKELKCAFDSSPVGVWIDAHRKVLLISAGILALGGATAMYMTKAGDMPADWMTKLAKDRLPTVKIGALDLSAKNLTFVPSRREIGLELHGTATLERVRSSFQIKGQAAGGSLTALEGAGSVVVPLGTGTSGRLGGSIGLEGYSLMLGISHQREGLSVDLSAKIQEKQETWSYGGSAGVKYRTAAGSVPLSFDATAGVGGSRSSETASWKTEYSVKVGLSVSF